MMVAVALCAFVLRVAADRFIKFNIAQNESAALNTLKLISAALENYAEDNRGVYPTNLALLTQPKPPYLDRDATKQSPLKGYNYGCLRLEPSGYSCYAMPVKCRLTGKISFSVTTGNILAQEACDKK
jgi:type II secretory pathway pseudopilin PulG